MDLILPRRTQTDAEESAPIYAWIAFVTRPNARDPAHASFARYAHIGLALARYRYGVILIHIPETDSIDFHTELSDRLQWLHAPGNITTFSKQPDQPERIYCMSGPDANDALFTSMLKHARIHPDYPTRSNSGDARFCSGFILLGGIGADRGVRLESDRRTLQNLSRNGLPVLILLGKNQTTAVRRINQDLHNLLLANPEQPRIFLNEFHGYDAVHLLRDFGRPDRPILPITLRYIWEVESGRR